jgi:pimeloyl-ACP methyl ester carboxylesterase
VHGVRDTIVHIDFGERLYALIPGPKQFIRMREAGHNDHDQFGAQEMVKPFLLGR